MGGQTPAQQPLRGAVADAGGAPQGIASGGKEGRDGRDRGHGGERPGEHKGGGIKLGEVRGPRPESVQGRRPSGGSTCAATRPETVEDVVVGDGGCETAI